MKIRLVHILHTVFWIGFYLNSILTYPSEYLSKYGILNIGLKQGTAYLIMIFLFYGNYLYAVPRFLARKKSVLYVVSFVVTEIAGLGLFLLHAWFLDWYFDAGDFFMRDRISGLPNYAFQIMFFTVISTGARFAGDWFASQTLREELERQKTTAELSLLRSQLSPHFLFNALNNIYSLVLAKHPAAAEAILKLSDLMRYNLRESHSDSVAMNAEIENLRAFIELRKLSLRNPGIVRFDVRGERDGLRIAPMILISFIENAFKHGEILSEDAFIHIDIVLSPHALRLLVSNSVSDGRKDAVSGIGVRNVRRRLELQYPGRHDLRIRSSADVHTVELDLNLS